jgi:hypothetical protein
MSSAVGARVAVANGIAIDRNRSLNQPPRTRAAMPMRPIVAGSREAVQAFGLVPAKRYGLARGCTWQACTLRLVHVPDCQWNPACSKPEVHKKARVDRRLCIWR